MGEILRHPWIVPYLLDKKAPRTPCVQIQRFNSKLEVEAGGYVCLVSDATNNVHAILAENAYEKYKEEYEGGLNGALIKLIKYDKQPNNDYTTFVLLIDEFTILSTDSYDFGDPKSVSEDPEVREKLEACLRAQNGEEEQPSEELLKYGQCIIPADQQELLEDPSAWVNDISASLSPLPSPSPQTEDHDVTHAGGVEDFYLAQPPLVMEDVTKDEEEEDEEDEDDELHTEKDVLDMENANPLYTQCFSPVLNRSSAWPSISGGINSLVSNTDLPYDPDSQSFEHEPLQAESGKRRISSSSHTSPHIGGLSPKRTRFHDHDATTDDMVVDENTKSLPSKTAVTARQDTPSPSPVTTIRESERYSTSTQSEKVTFLTPIEARRLTPDVETLTVGHSPLTSPRHDHGSPNRHSHRTSPSKRQGPKQMMYSQFFHTSPSSQPPPLLSDNMMVDMDQSCSPTSHLSQEKTRHSGDSHGNDPEPPASQSSYARPYPLTSSHADRRRDEELTTPAHASQRFGQYTDDALMAGTPFTSSEETPIRPYQPQEAQRPPETPAGNNGLLGKQDSEKVLRFSQQMRSDRSGQTSNSSSLQKSQPLHRPDKNNKQVVTPAKHSDGSFLSSVSPQIMPSNPSQSSPNLLTGRRINDSQASTVVATQSQNDGHEAEIDEEEEDARVQTRSVDTLAARCLNYYRTKVWPQLLERDDHHFRLIRKLESREAAADAGGNHST